MNSRKSQYNKFKVKKFIRLKNKYNGEIIEGDLIDEEEIEGKKFLVVINSRGSIIKLTSEAYTVSKGIR